MINAAAVRKYSRPKNHPGHRSLSPQDGELANIENINNI